MKFGSTVKSTQVYRRRCRVIPKQRDGYVDYQDWKVWERIDKPISGLFLGYRTLSNGVREYQGEAGLNFSPVEHFKAALICPSERSKPVYVPADTICEGVAVEEAGV